MSTTHEPTEPTRDSGATYASTYADERWQGPSFAASWISPPSPQRYAGDPTAPSREDDHA